MPSTRRGTSKAARSRSRTPSKGRLCKACQGKTASEGGLNTDQLAKLTSDKANTRKKQVAELKKDGTCAEACKDKPKRRRRRSTKKKSTKKGTKKGGRRRSRSRQ